jgi:hypothetical protein
MSRLVLACVLLVACDRQRDIQVLFGPTVADLSIGFQCKDANGDYLLAKAIVPGTGKARFQLVVDLIGMGPRLPGCRGEEIIASCAATGQCQLQPPSVGRYCETVELDVAGLGNEASILAQLRDTFHDTEAGRIIEDAPDVALIVRAVVTLESCASIERVEQDRYQPLVGTDALGCAYSCPFVPDTVQGSITLGLDGTEATCESNMRLCARFPVP